MLRLECGKESLGSLAPQILHPFESSSSKNRGEHIMRLAGPVLSAVITQSSVTRAVFSGIAVFRGSRRESGSEIPASERDPLWVGEK
jgi:hypothetical protein